MKDSKHRLRQSSGRQMLLLSLLAGAFWMANTLSGGSAGGQPPKGDPAPPPVTPAAVLKQLASGTVPPGAVTSTRLRFNFVIQPDTPLKNLLPIPPKTRAGAPRL